MHWLLASLPVSAAFGALAAFSTGVSLRTFIQATQLRSWRFALPAAFLVVINANLTIWWITH